MIALSLLRTELESDPVQILDRSTTCDVPADTLHRFCKKEHDWGWKKFMELSKVLEGFTVEDTLIIKAQVQVIRCAAAATPGITALSKSASYRVTNAPSAK